MDVSRQHLASNARGLELQAASKSRYWRKCDPPKVIRAQGSSHEQFGKDDIGCQLRRKTMYTFRSHLLVLIALLCVARVAGCLPMTGKSPRLGKHQPWLPYEQAAGEVSPRHIDNNLILSGVRRNSSWKPCSP